MTLGLAGAAGADVLELISTNEEAGGFFGAAVAGIPDVNGDGVDDVIVGAPEENGGGVNDAGRVYIYSGLDGAFIRAHSSPSPTVEGDYGLAVAGIPDINGDGRGDYAVGAPLENGPGGRVYVYSGATGALIRTHTSPNAESGGRFGAALAGLFDVNNDGRGDLIIGAFQENGGRGRAYVYSGNTGNLIRTHNSPNAEPLGAFGRSVAAVPDTDNDGRGDYVVGAPYEDPGASPIDCGRAYVFSGINGALRFTLASPNAQPEGHFGFSVAGVPDVGGNGSGDILVGAPLEDVNAAGDNWINAGRAYLFSGTNGGLGHTYQAPDADINDEDIFGYAVAGIMDRSGDGLGDVVIGAPGWPGYHAYVFRGTGDFVLLENIGTPDPLGANQLFASAVAAVGDANGDGKGDFVIGARGADNFPTGPSESGRAYLHRSLVLNDACSALFIQILSNGPNPFTNIGAGGTSSAPGACLDDIAADVWFTYTATCTGSVEFSTCNSVNFDTIIAVYDGCTYTQPFFFCSLGDIDQPLACNDDSFGCGGFSSRVSVFANAGDCFFVRVGGWMGDQGFGVLNVSCGCEGDLDGDGTVGGGDLGILLSQWGGAGSADLTGDGVVNGADLGALLSLWGPC